MKMQATTLCFKLLVCFLLTLYFPISAIAQQTPAQTEIVTRLNLSREKNETPILFIHFDKNIYAHNERVWFTGYLFNSMDLNAYKTLSVALVKNDDRQVLLEDKFLMSNGVVLGSTAIPDTLTAGEYNFIAFTNRLINGKPNVLFTQRVTIKSTAVATYTASLNPLDTSATVSRQKVMLLVNFLNAEKQPETVPVSYYVGNSLKPILKGNLKTEFGKYIFDIPSNLLSAGNNTLHVSIKHNNEVKDLNMELPFLKKPATVKFYPEGGALVNNIQSNVGWEVTDYKGKPIKANGILYQDKKVIGNITTNSYGINRFLLKPAAGHRYYVKLVGINRKDTLYALPTALHDSPVLTIANAVVNDTLTAIVKTNYPQKLYIIGHDYRDIFFSSPIYVDAREKRVKILLNDLPKGLTQITLIDSLGRPYAERLIFAHFDKKSKMEILTDSATYHARQKVTVKIKMNDFKSKLDSGLVSIACVQQNRLDIKNQKDIESYFYLHANLANLPLKENYLGEQKFDRQFLEDILLIKGWTKYKWLDMINPPVADTAKFEDVFFKGNVTKKKKPVSKSLALMSFGNTKRPISTNEKGEFELSYNDLITTPDMWVNYVVKGAPEFEYEVNLTDPYKVLNKKIADSLEIAKLNIVEQPSTRELQLAGNEHTIKIKEVQIKATAIRKVYANACGDYICRFNIFNCPNHRYESDNVLPKVGRSYVRSGYNTVYLGCGATDNKLALKGIYLPKRFYVEDVPAWSPGEPLFLSTLYWKHLQKLRSDEYAEVSFYTGDITGDFKIVIQGVAGNDVTYGEKSFKVIAPVKKVVE
jgi:hypothetical protein